MAGYRVTIRQGSRVTREEHDELAPALAALERGLEAIDPHRDPVHFIRREIPAVQQVAARGEIRGPRGVRGGVDLRGDGSAEAFTGSLRRRIVEQGKGESAYRALRRALTSS